MSEPLKFQVNLRGIIELLSNHLYESPEVYLRELLQNGVDAITARRASEPDLVGQIGAEIIEKADGGPTTLIFGDNGAGLTEAEVHRFLATIGESSKRGAASRDFLGQFGIGLLSCFVVSDEIVVVTRAKDSAPVEWRGRADGTYDVRVLDDLGVTRGTRVFLKCKPGAEDLFRAERVVELAQRYGGLLPHAIDVIRGPTTVRVNDEVPVFRRRFFDEASRRRAALDYGRSIFGVEFLDAVFVHSERGDVEGVAFVQPNTVSATARRSDRIYLKGMLLTESTSRLLPS
jgi:molecular chaperone HtpG